MFNYLGVEAGSLISHFDSPLDSSNICHVWDGISEIPAGIGIPIVFLSNICARVPVLGGNASSILTQDTLG